MDMPILTRAGNAPLQQECKQMGTPSSPRHVLPWLGGRVCPACRASRCDESTCRVERMAASSAEAATAAAARAWRAPWLTMLSLDARSSCTSGPATQMPTCDSRCSCIAGKTASAVWLHVGVCSCADTALKQVQCMFRYKPAKAWSLCGVGQRPTLRDQA